MMREETSGLSAFGEVMTPSDAIEPILSRPVRSALLEWLTEIWSADDLVAVGLKPRARAMFHGPPGVGKTTLAHHLAARLGLPLVAVRPDRVVDSYLGSTGRNLGALFDAARAASPDDPRGPGQGPVVLFFDEFEAICQKRVSSARDAQREMNSVVGTLLQRIEAHDGFIIAATNVPGDIDTAIWRRFDMHIALDLPGDDEVRRILSRYLAPYGLPADAMAGLAHACETASPALLRQFCEGLKRAFVLGERLGWDMRREAVIDRLVASIAPHKDLGKPRLWALGGADKAVSALPWPLPLATDLIAEPAEPATSAGPRAGNVVSLVSEENLFQGGGR